MKNNLKYVTGFTVTLLCIGALNTSAQQASAVNDTKKVKSTNAELLSGSTPAPDRNQFSNDEEYSRAKSEYKGKNSQAAPVRAGFATEEQYNRAKQEWVGNNPAAYEMLSAEKPATFTIIKSK
jgi:hypothetical protein